MDISSPKLLIICNTLLYKAGKSIEPIIKVFDSCSRTYQLGIKILICGLWDGKSSTLTIFTIQIEPSKNRNLKNKELAI
jgi:hypothetical protein